ncbi:MAG TPA: cyclic 2,3-diphosphoglycerate synthase [Candidatus Bathyarchaeia archaeon]|nr:cyclic 2,3-diphosphoglycerate synthase [Candidatus Bathyarchaeia archaeon]
MNCYPNFTLQFLGGLTLKKVVIMGAAGRDFHNYNMYFRGNSNYRVVAFTVAQIPGIQCRVYPPELAGADYPEGILVFPEEELPQLIREFGVDEVVFAYSDVSHEYVMHKASLVLACGADFRLMGPKTTMLKATVPVISVCAVRTGAGKSQTSRQISQILKSKGLRVVVVRHPMPYGDLAKQIWQRFATYGDLDKYNCTIEEREEYEPHLDSGVVVFAGVDYQKILGEAEKEAEVIVWDGGNNDLPFLKPDLHIVVADPHRAGHELAYYPGEANVRLADVVIVNKVDTADPAKVELVKENVASVNPNALVLVAASPISVDKPELVKGQRVLVIEDGPTLTHGSMPYGAATIAAKNFGAKEVVRPQSYAVGSIKAVYERYPHLGSVLPTMGYSEAQIAELKATIDAVPCDVVLIGTPIDLRRVMEIHKQTVRVKYELQVLGPVCLEEIVDNFLKRREKHE